jgi:hypothetical protein
MEDVSQNFFKGFFSCTCDNGIWHKAYEIINRSFLSNSRQRDKEAINGYQQIQVIPSQTV